ncbi:ABC transporter substrate-binding protein [Klebsiella pneumoniae subsp. pneumoniae]|nr:ABC transporter substrate-binding protein [Klebsiella pneumoniae subsp. pneumoniae]
MWRFPKLPPLKKNVSADGHLDDINAKGGCLGTRNCGAGGDDPASNWPLFAEKARQLLARIKCGGGRLAAGRRSRVTGPAGV